MPLDFVDRSNLTARLPTLHVDQVRAFNQRTRLYAIRCGRRWGKALALDTWLPTPLGWTTMGEVKVGDELFDDQGKICHVTDATDVMFGRPCNRVLFSDRSEIVADDDHRWSTWDYKSRKNFARSGIGGPKVRTTGDIRRTLTSNDRGDSNHSIPCVLSLDLPDVSLPIHPYVLGAWLGDGTSASAGFTCHLDDSQIIEEIRSFGQPVQKSDKDPIGWSLSIGPHGKYDDCFRKQARGLGVLRNKHIPDIYLRASSNQRMLLLQGLMDTDGNTNDKGNCEFCSTNLALADDVLELALSLGIRATKCEGRAIVNDKDCGEKFRINFTTSKPVFRLKRKIDDLNKRVKNYNTEQRFIRSVDRIRSVPVRCIAVDSESHLYLASRAFIPTHNTDLGATIASDRSLKKWPIGWFAPEYKFVAPAYARVAEILGPAIENRSKTEGRLSTISGGVVEFWTLDNPNAGRSRKYKLVIIDEGAFTKNGEMMDTWQKSIRPTLVDYSGAAIVLSNTNGIDSANFLWQICNEGKHGFTEFHAPSHNNPFLPRQELIQIEKDYPPLVFQQEYLAEFVDWSGAAFFDSTKLLVYGKPVPWPLFCDSVYAIIDTAVKLGNERDGTAVTYFALSTLAGIPLTILDWDIRQIEGSMLIEWLPEVFSNLEHMSRRCKALHGSAGALIEDKNSGTILIQQAQRDRLPGIGIDSVLTSLGKDARAISISKYHHQGMVKISDVAHERRVVYKEHSANHLMQQITGYRVGIDNKEDDLLDTYTYGVAVGLGDSGGI